MAQQQRCSGLVVHCSAAAEPALAVSEIASAIGTREMAGGLLFCSHSYPRDELAEAVRSKLAPFPLIGCTSAGELTNAGYGEDSIVFIGFPADAFAMQVLAFGNLNDFVVDAARDAVRQFAADADRGSRRLGNNLHHAALFLVDGLSHREELLTMTIQEALGDTVMVGGSSGDGMAFAETGILIDGRFVDDAAVVAIISSTRPMHVFCEHHYRAGQERMVVTAADPQARIVFEINALPAAQEYARVAGHGARILNGTELDSAFFAAHPPMVRAGGQFHVRAVQAANPDGSLTFYGAIDTGIVMRVGEPLDRLVEVEALLGRVEREVGEIDHVIGFDCVLNRVDAENRQTSHAMSQLFVQRRVVGFNTYGEQYRTAHINQTFAGLAIGC